MEIERSIVMPCLDEAQTVGRCVAKAYAFLERHAIAGEVIVADIGSTDGSRALSEAAGARVVPSLGEATARRCEPASTPPAAASWAWVTATTATTSRTLMPFLERLRAGEDLVVGNRGGIEDGAMPLLLRHLGNPVLSLLARLFFRAHRRRQLRSAGFSRDAFRGLDIQGMGTEFALEMIVKASILGLRVCEVPTTSGRTAAAGRRT